ncbi:MAG: hypothetical protein LBF67_00265 [Prevotellaceae bacterium]|nr:hypothetical protein [Prevotellaceae bacterium]
MKLAIKSSSIAGALFAMSLTVTAQHPAISSKYQDTAQYPDEKIEALIRNYHAAHSHDVFPSNALLQQLNKDFPAARDVEWETAAGIYEAEFEISWRDYKAYYDAEGHLLAYSFDIRLSELPPEIKSAAKAKYPNFRFSRDVEKSIKGRNIFYRVELERGETEVKATFTSDGSFVKERFD